MTTEVPEPVADQLLACPKCGETARLPVDTCPRCRRHLYLKCGECQTVNLRRLEQCHACGARLKHTLRNAGPHVERHVWPVRWSFNRRRKWLLPVQIALFMASVSMASFTAITIVESLGRRAEPPPPEVYVVENGKLQPVQGPLTHLQQ